MMEYRSWYRKSSNGEGDIFSAVYEVENPKAIIQIAHGMCEHFGRYEEFANALAKEGYLVCGNDHLGHGNSHMNHRGTFALKEGGFQFVLQDMNSLFEEMKELYPGLPCVLLGHSMGSILAALFAEQYDYLDELILMGCPVQNKLTGLAKIILNHNVKKYGYTHQSKFCNFVMWGPESLTLEQKRKSKSWMSYDKENVERFITDEKCAFSFNDSANLELVQGLAAWGNKDWGEKIEDIPILVIAGADDMIGKNGKGPKYYYERLKKHHSKAILYLIENNRHEILNEANREEAYEYIIKWIENSL